MVILGGFNKETTFPGDLWQFHFGTLLIHTCSPAATRTGIPFLWGFVFRDDSTKEGIEGSAMVAYGQKREGGRSGTCEAHHHKAACSVPVRGSTSRR